MEESFYPPSLQRKTWKQNLSANEKLGECFFLLLHRLKTLWASSTWGSHRPCTPLTAHACACAGSWTEGLVPSAEPNTHAATLPSQIAPCSLQPSGKALHRASGSTSTFSSSHCSAEDTLLPVLQLQLDLCHPCLPPSRWQLARERYAVPVSQALPPNQLSGQYPGRWEALARHFNA